MKRYLLPTPFLFCICCTNQQCKSSWKKSILEGQWKFVSATKVEDTPFLLHYPNPHTPMPMREQSFNDGAENYLLKFPHTIPDSIEISRAQFISGLEQNKTYWMSTDGKKREYSFSYRGHYLHFTPSKWYQGEDPWIHFSKKKPLY